MPTIYIYRGLPGSGKSTAAGILAAREEIPILSADNFFMKGGKYHFNPSLLGKAHNWVLSSAIKLMEAGQSLIIDNTNTQHWEYSVYQDLAHAMGYEVEVIDIYDGGCTDEQLATRNTHGVPLEAIRRMRGRYESRRTRGEIDQ